MQKKIWSKFQFNAILALTVLGVACNSFADDPDKMPTAEMVFKKYIEASGGVEKLKAIKSVKMSGNVEAKAMGISGTVEINLITPNMVLEKANLPAVGVSARGTNGEVAWENTTMTGPRIIEGKEKSRLFEQANFERIYAPNKYYKEIKVLGTETIDDKKCYSVKLVRKDDFESTEYFSIETGLPMRTDATLTIQMGDIEIKSKMLEYKDVNGVKFPSKIEMAFPNGMSQVVTIEKIEVNGDIDKSSFDPPKDVKGLIEGSTDG